MKSADIASLRMLRLARDRIDRDYADEIGIPALAAGAGYSREHFIRAFRTVYGEPGRTCPHPRLLRAHVARRAARTHHFRRSTALAFAIKSAHDTQPRALHPGR